MFGVIYCAKIFDRRKLWLKNSFSKTNVAYLVITTYEILYSSNRSVISHTTAKVQVMRSKKIENISPMKRKQAAIHLPLFMFFVVKYV